MRERARSGANSSFRYSQFAIRYSSVILRGMSKRVLVTRRVPESGPALLRQAGFIVDILDTELPPARADVLARVRGCDGVVAMLTDRIDPEFLDAAGSQLKVVANFGVGFDNIDRPACAARGVTTTNTPDVLTDATADIAWVLILAVARHAVVGDRTVRQGQWIAWAPTQMLGMPIAGRTLGVIGAGRIGTAVARRGTGFGMNLVYVARREMPEMQKLRAKRVTLDELLAQADFISLNCPLTPETRHMIGAAQFAKMKPTAILVNTSRGAVVDEAALVEALRTKRIWAAGLDVYEFEPKIHPGLPELENVVLLPHLGSANVATRERMSQLTAENVAAVLSGRAPLTPIP